jgi:hypothetical protein
VLLANLLLSLAMLQSPTPQKWYGPQEVNFNIQYSGNPYDPAYNDVTVHFVNERGFAVDRLAYFSHGSWKAVLVAPQPGHYKATLLRNGHESVEEAVPAVLILDEKLPHGFIHTDHTHLNRFSYDDGTYMFPIGFDLGWQTAGMPTMVDQLVKMNAVGLNWTRIWSCGFDNRNPWIPHDDPYAIKDQLWPKALDNLAVTAKGCNDSSVNFQFVLFNHGAFSSKTDSEWRDNPWNAAKGGFLKSADDFFTDPEAKRRTKMWLRYAVARWAGNPNLFAWELFNEVEWTDAAKDGHWNEIENWHKEMADYIRSLDPYGHPITTSSEMNGGLFEPMDYYQPHEYADNLPLVFDAYTALKNKPLFVGEFGPNHEMGMKERPFIRNVLWDSIKANGAATAMYWYWDRVEKYNLYPEFTIWSKILDRAKFGDHATATSIGFSSNIGTAEGLRDIAWALVRIRGAEGKSPRISFPGMVSGTWNVTWFNLDTGEEYNDLAATHGVSLQLSAVKGQDVVALLRLG